MTRRVLMLVLMAVYTLVSAVGYAPPAHAQESEPLGRVTLRWTLTVQGSDTYSKECDYKPPEGYAENSEQWSDQLTLTYEGKWTWKVLRDDAGVEHLEMDLGQGEYNVSGAGGGSRQYKSSGGPKADLCPAGRGLRDSYWVPVAANESSNWAYQAQKGEGGHAYTTLTRQGDEMYYEVDWDWVQEITLDGSMAENSRGCTSSSSGDKCGTSTFFPLCPGSGGAQAEVMLALGQAMQAWQDEESLEGKVRPKDWGFSVSGRASYNPDPIVQNDTGEDCHSGQTMQGSAVLAYTLTYEREPPNLEAVLTVPLGEYEQWQPEAGRSEDEVGNQLRVEAELRYKDRPEQTPIEKATFRFRLVDTSREPGVCLNAPAKDQAKKTPDLKIDADSNPDLQLDDIEGDQAASTKKTARGAGVTISSYDWGAYGRLEVTATIEGEDRVLTAHLDGQPDKEQLTIPLDDNDNHIADAWEKAEGVFGQNLPANWDGSPIPRGQKSDGDGISLYEKYRGFAFGSSDQVRHERLAALAKHVFIYDPDGIVLQTMTDSRSAASSVPKVSQCRVRFLGDGQWTGTGQAGSKKRLVNFNTSGFGHAVDQHALEVVLDSSNAPTVPPDWQRLYTTAAGHAYTDTLASTLGMTWPDYSFANPLKSPGGSLRISIYSGNIEKSIGTTVGYHSPAGDDESKVQQYIREHMDQWEERRVKRTADVISHEVGHGIGIDHHAPTDSGDKTCVMRYFAWADCPRNANDRFELACRSPWPSTYGTSGPNCWGQVQVSDK